MITTGMSSTRPRLCIGIHAFAVTVFYSLLYTAFFSPVIFSGRHLAPGDGFIYYLPNFYSRKSFWEPLLHGGFPLFADPQVMMWYPPAIIFSLFHSWNGFVVSAYVLASCFTYGYVYTIAGSRLASFISGTIYGMSGFMMVHLGHTTIIHTAAWIPLFIWALEKLRHNFTYQWLIVAGLSIALTALAGHPQIFFYTLGVGVVYAGVLGWSAPIGRWKYYGLSLITATLGLSLAAIQLLPTAELASLGFRTKMTFTDFISYSLPLYQVVSLLFPYFFGGSSWSFYKIRYWGEWNLTELTGFIGLLPLILSAIGFMSYSQKSITRFWVGIGLLAFLLTLGDALPLAKLMYHLPVYNKFRVPARHFVEMSFAVAVLGGFGIAAIQRQDVTKRLILKVLSVCFGVMFIGLVFVFLISDKLIRIMAIKKGVGNIDFYPWANPAVGVPLLIFFISGISLLVWSRKSGSRFRQLFLISVLIIDMGSFSWFLDRSPSKNILSPPPVAQKCQGLLNNSNQRMLPVRGVFSEIPPNISRLWGVPSASYYGPMILKRVSQLLSMAPHGAVSGDWASEGNRSLDVMAIRYIFLPRGDIKPLHGFNWATDDLPVALGSGCGEQQPDSAKFNFPKPVTATKIGVVSAMACSTGVPNNAEVLRILVTDASGKVRTLNLYAGRDTSEWAYDREDVLPHVKHGRATIFESFPVVEGSKKHYQGHKYIAVLPLDKLDKIKCIELKWVGPSGAIGIKKLSLLDEKTGQSYPVMAAGSGLSDTTRWRHVEDIGEASIYENLRAMPRAWLVPEVVSMKDEDMLRTIKSSEMPDGRIFDPSRVALVEEPFTLKIKNFDESAEARMIHLDDTSVEIHTNSISPAFLVLSDVYYPGWKVTIDGIPMHVFQTDYAIRGVMVPAGSHIVRFEFRPRSFYLGAEISIISLLLLIGIFFVTTIRKQKAAYDG